MNKISPFFVCGLFCSFSLMGDIHHINNNPRSLNLSNIKYLYSQPKDTIHLLSDEYILISLKNQTASVVRRGDSLNKITFPVSTGHSGIDKGMATPPGFYTVQSKLSKAISRQFNNAELINWVGFNGNIGFHGLSSSGYYSHLGVRPSSHGCVRISREDGKKLSNLVKLGTPVLVYSDEPAITIAFAEMKNFDHNNDILLEKKTKATDLLVKSRQKALYSGDYYKLSNSKLFINGRSIIKNRGFSIGSASKIAKVQRDFKTSFESGLIKQDFTNVKIKYLEYNKKSLDETESNVDSISKLKY